MPFDGSGTFNPPAPPVYPPVYDTVISEVYFQALMSDVFDGLSNAVTRDGQSPALANLPMGGFKHTGVDDATLPDEYASYGQVTQVLNAPVTSNFIQNLSAATIPRLGDRVFIGGANANDGNFPNVLKDWYTTYEVAQGRANGIIVSAQFACLTNTYVGAAIGGVFAARTSNLGPTVGGAVGLEAHVVNERNNAASLIPAWAAYSEATRDNDDNGSIITYEFDTRNKGTFHQITPKTQNAKMSVNLQIAAGGAFPDVGVDDSSAGINFRDNPTQFGAAIVVGENSLRPDPVQGYGLAMVMGPSQRLTWYTAGDEQGAAVSSTLTDPDLRTRLEFFDGGAAVVGPTDDVLFLVRPVDDVENYIGITSGGAGITPLIEAIGTGNTGIKIQTEGLGLLEFGNSANFVANGTVAVSLGSTGPAGISGTVKEWLAIRNAAGAFRVIPLYGP